MTDIYETAEVSAAKNAVYDLITEACEVASVGSPEDEPAYDAITIADRIVKMLQRHGVTIPDDFPDPHPTF